MPAAGAGAGSEVAAETTPGVETLRRRRSVSPSGGSARRLGDGFGGLGRAASPEHLGQVPLPVHHFTAQVPGPENQPAGGPAECDAVHLEPDERCAATKLNDGQDRNADARSSGARTACRPGTSIGTPDSALIQPVCWRRATAATGPRGPGNLGRAWRPLRRGLARRDPLEQARGQDQRDREVHQQRVQPAQEAQPLVRATRSEGRCTMAIGDQDHRKPPGEAASAGCLGGQ